VPEVGVFRLSRLVEGELMTARMAIHQHPLKGICLLHKNNLGEVIPGAW
jgi:hypothetical protein